jgi:hypothetical protein
MEGGKQQNDPISSFMFVIFFGFFFQWPGSRGGGNHAKESKAIATLFHLPTPLLFFLTLPCPNWTKVTNSLDNATWTPCSQAGSSEKVWNRRCWLLIGETIKRPFSPSSLVAIPPKWAGLSPYLGLR